MGNEEPRVPLTYKQAVEFSEIEKWKAAIDEEISQLNKNTWKLVPLPPGEKKVKSKWFYLSKIDAHQRVNRKRARLVAKGFTQRYGFDYDEVFSPVAKYGKLRFILAMATQEQLELLQLDVKAAFLNGDLKEELYMEQLPGYCSSRNPDFVYRLNRAIYGLKQASRAWHMHCDAFSKSIGCVQSGADKSLHLLVFKGTRVFILVYVDDMLLAGSTLAVLKEVAQIIGNRFAVCIENKITKCLGIIIDRYREKGEIIIHGAVMIDHMLETFNMHPTGVSPILWLREPC